MQVFVSKSQSRLSLERDFFTAVEGNDINKVKELLERVNVNLQNKYSSRLYNYGRTALMIVSYWGNEDIVKLLLKAGANVNLQDIYGETPLCKASEKGHIPIVKLLQ